MSKETNEPFKYYNHSRRVPLHNSFSHKFFAMINCKHTHSSQTGVRQHAKLGVSNQVVDGVALGDAHSEAGDFDVLVGDGGGPESSGGDLTVLVGQFLGHLLGDWKVFVGFIVVGRDFNLLFLWVLVDAIWKLNREFACFGVAFKLRLLGPVSIWRHEKDLFGVRVVSRRC